MATGIEAAGTGLKTILTNTIQTTDPAYCRQIFAPNELPDSINVFPTFLILLGRSEPISMGEDVDLALRLFILFAQVDSPSAADKLHVYIEQTGNYSVYAAVASDRTLNGGAESSEVISNSGLIIFSYGGHDYLATEFEVKCYA